MKDRSVFRGVTVTLAAFLVLLALLLWGLNSVAARSGQEQAAALRGAVLRAVLTCYAAEGRYPPDVAYLTAHYGLTYDSKRFIVRLDAFAENLLPDISVLTEGEA